MNQETTDYHLLMRHRSHHMDNLQRLKDASKSWDKATTARGEATMANLMQQVYAIDEQLSKPITRAQQPAPEPAQSTWERVDTAHPATAPMCM